MTSLALGPQLVSQAPRHFRSFETQATCDGCFARQSFCLVISLHFGMFGAVHPQEFSKVDVGLGLPFHFSLFVASSLSLRMMACMKKTNILISDNW